MSGKQNNASQVCHGAMSFSHYTLTVWLTNVQSYDYPREPLEGFLKINITKHHGDFHLLKTTNER